MAATPRQIAANRQNSLHSTGPRTEEGKEASRRNALKHGMTGAGVVIPGEDEHEVAIREVQLAAELAPEGGVAARVLVRQFAIASIRTERAFRHESALAAERMRRAGDAFDDDRRVLAEAILADLPIDPATSRRRLMMGAEGIDALVGRLRALAAKAELGPGSFVAWDQEEGDELDRCLGWRPEGESKSRVGLLTRGIAYEHWVGLDPAEFGELSSEERRAWAAGQIGAIIAGEVASLEAHRGTLAGGRAEQSRAESAERELLDLGRDGTALRRYAGAAERTMFKVLGEIRQLRREACQAAAPAEASEPPTKISPQVQRSSELPSKSASFSPASPAQPRPGRRVAVGAILDDFGASAVPITIGRRPLRPDRPTP